MPTGAALNCGALASNVKPWSIQITLVAMSDAVQLRLIQLRRLHPELRPYDDHWLLNAFCIDIVYGAAFAWAYLLKCGLPYDHVQAILHTATESWDFEVQDILLTADSAMATAGLHA